MTAKDYLQKKYPQMRGDKWNSHDVIDDNWVAQMMTEFAKKQVKNISSKPVVIKSVCPECGSRKKKVEKFECKQ